MNFKPIPKTDWWHERPTKAADLSTAYRSFEPVAETRKGVWKKGALIVALMFAFILSLISMMVR